MNWGVVLKINLKRIIPILSCLAIVLVCIVVPVKVSADAVDKSFVNILPAAEYNARSADGSYSINTVTARNYFPDVLNPGFRWEAEAYDMSFRGFVFTLFFQGNRAPQSVDFIPYVNGPVYTAELVTRVGNTYQYRLDFTANINIASVEIRAIFAGNYTGFFSVLSCYGILSDVVSVEKLAYQVLRYTQVSGLGDSRQVLNSAGSTDLPIYLTSDYEAPSSNFYDVYNFGVRNQYLKFDYLEEATFLFATTHSNASVSAYIADDQNLWSNSPIYKTLSVDLSYSFTAKHEFVSGRYYNLYYYTATVDLRGVDLSDKMLNFTFDALPVGDNDTIASVLYLALKPPIEEVPWYQAFYRWITSFWSKKNNQLVDQLTDALQQGNDILVNGTPDQQQQVAAGKDNLESGASDLEQLTQDMQVTKPTVNVGDFSADVVLGASGMNLMATPFTALWQSPTLVTVIVALVSIMLISYVFFGKKG